MAFSKSTSWILLAGFILLVAGCSGLPFGPAPAVPTVALIPPPSITLPPATNTVAAPPAEIPTQAPVQLPTIVPPVVPVRPTLTPLPPVAPVQPGGRFTQVKIYLIAVEDNGRSGPLVGCGDSAIAVVRNISPTNAPLTAAIKDLLSLHDKDYGQSGLYNALYQSNLQVQGISIVNGVATIRLAGTLLQGGVCDAPRIQAQLTNTALQFSTVRSTQIFVNGTPLQNLLSGK